MSDAFRLTQKAANKTLRDMKGFGLKQDGSLKKGYVQLPDGRIVHKKTFEDTTPEGQEPIVEQ